MSADASIKVEFSGLKSFQSVAVFVDGEARGELGKSIVVSAGKHTIRVADTPFGSQDLAVFLRPNESLLLLCNRSWLASVATLLLFGAFSYLLPGRTTGDWHPANCLVLLVIDVL